MKTATRPTPRIISVEEIRRSFPRAIHQDRPGPVFLIVIALLGAALLVGMSVDVWKEWNAARPSTQSEAK